MHRKPLTFFAMLVLLSAPLFGQNKEPTPKPPEPLTSRSLDLLIQRLNDWDSKVREATAETSKDYVGQYAEFRGTIRVRSKRRRDAPTCRRGHSRDRSISSIIQRTPTRLYRACVLSPGFRLATDILRLAYRKYVDGRLN
jgi:hypothetical protein